MTRTTSWAVAILGGLGLLACGGAGGTSVQVDREGRDSQSFASVRFECTASQPDPSMPYTFLDCAHGDPEISGLELTAGFTSGLADLPAGTSLELGSDFEVIGFGGADDGAPWGASGFASWWTGTLVMTIGERDATGQIATLQGTLQTTAEVEVVPITATFDMAEVVLP